LKLCLTGADFGSNVYQGLIASQPLQSELAFAFLRESTIPALNADWEWPQLDWSSCEAELEAQVVELHVAHTEAASYFGNTEIRGCVSHDGLDARLQVLKQSDQPPLSESRIRSWLCGPLLILALARRGVFCLHAGAVRTKNGEAVLILGRSGVGKSTLARADPALSLVDDIAPVTVMDGQLYLLPHFPQLKLPQPFANLPERVPVAQIWHLQTPAQMSQRALSAIELAPIILQHTVASRLFAPLDWHRLWAMLPSAIRVSGFAVRAQRADAAELIQQHADTLLATYL
jgi:hypothetical protein